MFLSSLASLFLLFFSLSHPLSPSPVIRYLLDLSSPSSRSVSDTQHRHTNSRTHTCVHPSHPNPSPPPTRAYFKDNTLLVIDISATEVHVEGMDSSELPFKMGIDISTTEKERKRRWSAFGKKTKSRNSSSNNSEHCSDSKKSVADSKSGISETNSKSGISEANNKSGISEANVVKVSTFHKFFNYISRKFKKDKRKENEGKRKSMKGVIGIATTGAALILINEVNETSNTPSSPTRESIHSSINEFDLLDCAAAPESTFYQDKTRSKSSGDLSNERFKIPSPEFNPLKVIYDSLDDVVEGMFQNMVRNGSSEYSSPQ